MSRPEHERIWLEPAGAPDRCWCEDNQWGGEGVEYIRRDIHEAALLSAKREGMEEAAKVAEQLSRRHPPKSTEDREAMTMPMREKIARALRRQFNTYHFDRASDVGWEDELTAADAVLDALTEPTEGMVNAGCTADDDFSEAHPAKAATFIYWAMIQAARDGK